MKEYDIFIPLRYNDGTPIEGRKFQQLQASLLGEFGGLTYFPAISLGPVTEQVAMNQGKLFPAP